MSVTFRSLIFLVIVVAAGLGWIVRAAHVQRDAVAAIVNAGGTVWYSGQSGRGKSLPPETPPWAPTWLVEFVGVDFFVHVAGVNLERSSGQGDAVLANVGRLEHLQ
jgi:hypothetical protein